MIKTVDYVAILELIHYETDQFRILMLQPIDIDYRIDPDPDYTK